MGGMITAHHTMKVAQISMVWCGLIWRKSKLRNQRQIEPFRNERYTCQNVWKPIRRDLYGRSGGCVHMYSDVKLTKVRPQGSRFDQERLYI
jgi:hypothetical protein